MDNHRGMTQAACPRSQGGPSLRRTRSAAGAVPISSKRATPEARPVQNGSKSLYSLAMPFSIKTRRRLRSWRTRTRELRGVVKGLVSTKHPLLVHIIPIRRCNLACTYCNEFDDFSKPVETEEMFRRIDRLGAMGTWIVTISGGEPLLHPDLDAIIARIRKRGMLAGLITNGYLLTAERIERLNRAGLEYLQ